MSIRSSVKAVIVNDDKILLNKCSGKNSGEYYTLPGGGQHKYESLYEAVIRECKEETGYEIKPLKLIGLSEAICSDEKTRKNAPEYSHKIYHIFLCELINNELRLPTEQDSTQIGIEWIDINTLNEIRLFPSDFAEQIMNVLNGTVPVFWGSEQT